MNIALFNSNPVVEKLVTLSAQKIGSAVVKISTDEESKAEHDKFDLVIVDDESYDFFSSKEQDMHYEKSLFIHSKNSPPIETFDFQLIKPFLPTDLVELLSKVSSLSSTAKPTQKQEDEPKASEAQFSEIQDQDLDDALIPDLDEIDKAQNNDALPSMVQDNSDDMQTNSLSKDTDTLAPVLDTDDVKEVQALLDDTDNIDAPAHEDVEPEIIDLHEDEQANLQDDSTVSSLQTVDKDESKDLANIEDSEVPDTVDQNEEKDTIDAIEQTITNETDRLSNEELDAEISDDIIEDFDDELLGIDEETLRSALGEEMKDANNPEIKEISQEINKGNVSPKNSAGSGAKVLHDLLQVLNDKNIQASLEGMHININISIGKE